MRKRERGYSLLEVIIAMALLGIVAVALLSALATASRTVFVTDERATAESLARSQMEYVRDQEYSPAPWDYTLTSSQQDSTDEPDWWDPDNDNPPLLSSIYDGYTVIVSTVLLHDTDGDGDVDSSDLDDGMQKVTVTVRHPDPDPEGEEIVVTLEGYNRG